jgi:hypothetical protein
MDLNEVIGSLVSENGVASLTRGAVLSAQVREGLRNILKSADPEGYNTYREIKYPQGPGSDTSESRLAATRFIFDRARDLLVQHYVSSGDGGAA